MLSKRILVLTFAMASFLFVGCQGVTPDIPDDEGEEGTAVVIVGKTMLKILEPLGEVKTGTWTIEVFNIMKGFNISIIGPDYEKTLWVSDLPYIFAESAPIPGVKFKLKLGSLPAPLDTFHGEIKCTARTDAIDGRATLKFDEDVTYAAAVEKVHPFLSRRL